MDIATIRFVLEIEKTGSIGIAARNLFQSPPTLSHAIKALEAKLGGELFKRSNKGMVLTDLGRQFVSYVRPFYQQYECLEEICKGLSPTHPSLSVVSSPQKTVSNTFVQLCRDYAKQQCNFSYNEIALEDIIERVHSNLADIGVIIFVSHWKKTIMRLIKMKNLVYTPLTQEHPQVIVRAEHPLCRQKPAYVTFRQLEKYPYVTSYTGAFQYSATESDNSVSFLGGHGQIIVHNRAAMYDILHNTDAYSISSHNRLAYAGKAHDDGIATFPLQPVDFHLEVGWLKPIGTELSDIGQDFIGRLTALMALYHPAGEE